MTPERGKSGVACHRCRKPMTAVGGGSILTHVCLDTACRGAYDWDGYAVRWIELPKAVAGRG